MADIRELEGKRILVTSIVASKENVEAAKLFEDLQDVVDMDLKSGVKIDRTHPAKRLLNKFSGGYISPTMIKGFSDCPANQLLQALTPWSPTAVTSIGTSTHSIFQKFYELPSGERKIETLDKIKEEEIIAFGQQDSAQAVRDINWYVEGFKNTNDYLDLSKPVDHDNLNAFNEVHIKGTPKPLGVEIPKPIYTLMDRVDFRGENMDEVYIIDYKTGRRIDDYYVRSMDGYLPQLITYKWMVEMEYGMEVQGAYLLTPGTKDKVRSLDINSLENQSRWIDEIFAYCEAVDQMAKTRIFPEIHGKYCKYNEIHKQIEWALKESGSSSVKYEIQLDITLKKPEKEPEKDEENKG
ncbi:MAG: PD-(D/E)XK nuclease family protein [Methanobrevibacter sp.]|nr:PD-(D/E)XK nuclease family protein [Methanobrevibacter sp.]